MGIRVSIGVHAQHHHAPTAFKRLWRRMAAGGVVKYTEIYQGDADHCVDSDSQNIVPNLEAFVLSRDSLRVGMAYPTATGIPVPMELNFHGSAYEDGWPMRLEGHIAVSMALNDLARPLQHALRHEARLSTDTLASLGERAVVDAEEIFVRVCGIDDPRDATVQHAAMYLEGGWPSAAGCAMLYHRNVYEFAQDFGRIYAEYHWGVLAPSLFSFNGNVWELSTDDIRALAVRQPLKDLLDRDVAWISDERRACLQWLNELTMADVRHLAMLPATRVRELFREAVNDISEVTCYDYGDSGIAVTTDPLSSIWRVYQHVAMSVGS